MAEAFVSGVLEKLGSFAAEPILEELKLVVCLNKGVEKLTSEFVSIQAVLVDAEQRQFTEKSVRVWLERLNDVSYDVDHVLDQWRTANLQIDGEADQHADTFMSKVCSCFLFPYLVIRVRRVALAINLSFKITAINERLDGIAKEKDRYCFKIAPTIKQPIDRETTCFIDVPKVVGLDEQKNYLVGKLLNESREEQTGLQTISIIGVGGIGKTTLAQLAYNDNKVTDFFEKKIWVCVSDPFDKLRVAKAILKTLGHDSNSSTLQSLLEQINESLRTKIFLIVLDDVWTEDYEDWKPLHICLKNGFHGSKILITTRKERTAVEMQSDDTISIKELSDEQCLLVFRQLAFFGRSFEECEKLEEISREIVSKCKGLPLAAKTMGSLLRFKRTRKEWENILYSEMWKLKEFENHVFQPLLLSYYDLLPMVKRCFTYCAMFPKDFEFEKDELIKLWMAQGYLELEHNEEIEIIGEEYFNCLAMRSFFQDFDKDDDGSIIRCKMHDIVHDVAQYLSKNECCMIEVKDFREDFREQRVNALCEKARHLRLMVEGSDTFPISFCNFKKLRSLLVEIEFDDVGSKLIGTVLPKLFDELTGLKALGIRNAYIEHIPKEIGKLIHLRYLDLSNNEKLIKLPEALCELYNLQILKLDFCKNLEELPQGIGKLINLRHLMNFHTISLRYMPKGMERLIHLRTLNEFHLNNGDYGGKTCSLEFLGHIESLWIEGLKNLAKVTDEMVQLKNNEKIRDLGLDFRWSDSMNNDDEAILEAFQPPPNLQVLRILFYDGYIMSALRRMTSLTNLRSIMLRGCFKCLHMPPLGKLPSLETLFVYEMVSVGKVGNEFLGVESGEASSSSSSIIYFPNLKTLLFQSMSNWEVWDFGNEDDTCTIMPSLRSLHIRFSPKLKGLPKQQMAPLQHLEIRDCDILEEVYEKGK